MKTATEQLKSLNLVIINMIFKNPINTIKHTQMQDKRTYGRWNMENILKNKNHW